jgi:hypothetical protein
MAVTKALPDRILRTQQHCVSQVLRAPFGLWTGEMARAARVAPFGFGSVLVTILFTQNLGLMVFCSFHEVKGRYAQALDSMERAAGRYRI